MHFVIAMKMDLEMRQSIRLYRKWRTIGMM